MHRVRQIAVKGISGNYGQYFKGKTVQQAMQLERISCAAAIVLIGLSTSAIASDTEKLCVGQVCLGMDVENVSKIDLEAAGTFKVTFVKGIGTAYGLDADGQRVWFTTGDLNKQTASQFAKKVKTICAVDFLSGRVKASDGQLIRFTMRPVTNNGSPKLVVTDILRPLPSHLSDSDVKRFEAQAQERYGQAYSSVWTTVVKKPTATVKFDAAYGRVLDLRMPFDSDRSLLLAQKGCADKVTLD